MTEWVDVCAVELLPVDTGACALVGDQQVAVFHVRGGVWCAIDNIEPFTGAAVLSRGIVGDRGGVLKVSSPLHKQSFDLLTGVCLDQPDVQVAVHHVRVRRGRVQVALATQEALGAMPASSFTSSR